MTEESVQKSLIVYYVFLLIKKNSLFCNLAAASPPSSAPSLFPHSPLFPPPFLSWIKLT